MKNDFHSPNTGNDQMPDQFPAALSNEFFSLNQLLLTAM